MEADAFLKHHDSFVFFDVRIVGVTVSHFIIFYLIIIRLVGCDPLHMHRALKSTLFPDADHLSLSESIVHLDPPAAMSDSELVQASEFPTRLSVVLCESVGETPFGTFAVL
jgi:hypothetical protein